MPFAASSVVWVKCGALFWPAKVLDIDKDLDAEIRDEIKEEKRQPKYVVKFFDEDGYEFLYDDKNIFEYNCSRKEEFIKKGVTKSRTSAKDKSSWFHKFPKDIVQCEELTGGDPKLLEKPPYAEEKSEKVDYRDIFGTPDADKKGKIASPKKGAQAGGRKRKATDSPASKKKEPPQKQRPIVHPRFKPGGSGADHTVRMMVQPSTPMEIDAIKKQDESESAKSKSATSASPGAGTPGTGGGQYNCSVCGVSASRLNVFILMCKCRGGDKAGGTPSRSSSTPKSTPKGGRGSASKATKSPARTPSAAASGGRGRGRQTASIPAAAAKPKAVAASPRGRGRGKKAEAAATSTAEKPSTPGSAAKGGRGRAAPAAVKSGEASATSPEKKGRMTKKRKDEMAREEERKKEERKKLLGDWDEENDEDEDDGEKRDSDDEDAGYDFMDDDHLVGNTYEGEEEEEEKERKERESEEAKRKEEEEEAKRRQEEEDATARKKKEEEEAEAKKEKVEESTNKESEGAESSQQNGKSTENGGTSKDDESSNVADENLALDISKVLEETSVPSLPSTELDSEPAKEKEKPKKKGVTFSAEKPKEMKQKTIALVQPDSNLEEPDDDDVYDEFVNPREIPYAPPKHYQARKILKKIEAPEKEEKSKTDLPDDKEAESKNGVGTISVEEPKGINLETPDVGKGDDTQVKASTEEAAASAPPQERVIQLGKDWDEEPAAVTASQAETTASNMQQTTTTTVTVAPPTVVTQVVTAVPETVPTQVVTAAPETVAAVATNSASFATVAPATAATVAATATTAAAEATGAAGNEGTYLIMVDETQSAALDQQQTLYIDASQLANGDLSNMVLMTEEGVPVNVQGLSAQQGVVDQQQLLQQGQQQQPQPLQEQPQQPPQSEMPSGQP